MYDKKDKRRLYWLIDRYLQGEIDESIFCDEFYYSYDLCIDKEVLISSERLAFDELSEIVDRFTESEEDFKLDRNAFVSAQELKQKIIETKEKI